MRLIERTHYLEALKRVKGTPDIRWLPAFAARASRSYWTLTPIGLKNRQKANLIKINFSLVKFEPLTDYGP